MNSIDQTSIQTAITTITDTSTADYRKKLNAIKTILESNTPLAEDQKNTLKSALTQKASTTTQTDPQSNSFFKDLASCFRSVINGQSFISARKQIEPLSAQLRALLSDKCPRKNLPPSKTVSKEQILEFIKLCKFDKSGKRSSNKQDSKINTLIMTLWNKINAEFKKDNDEIDQLINFKKK